MPAEGPPLPQNRHTAPSDILADFDSRLGLPSLSLAPSSALNPSADGEPKWCGYQEGSVGKAEGSLSFFPSFLKVYLDLESLIF